MNKMTKNKQNDKMKYLVNCGVIEVECKRNISKRQMNSFLKVVQGYSLSLTSTVDILSIKTQRLQSLNIYFDRVSVLKKFLLAIGG